MIQYEKEKNISLEDIIKEKNNFEIVINYQNQLKRFDRVKVQPILYGSTFIGLVVLLNNLFINSESFGLSFLHMMMAWTFSYMGLLTASTTMHFLEIYPYKFLFKKEIKEFNNKFISEHGELPNIEQKTQQYYDYLTSPEVRLSLINETDNTLLMVEHYEIKNKSVSKLSKLKEKYLTFNLSSDMKDNFISLNHKIINKLSKINQSIDKISDNKFYTDYIKVSPIKPEKQLKLLDTKTKYKEIL